MEVILILTNLPDAGSAEALALHLVEQRLAACANLLAPVRSVYRWQDKIEQTSEVPLLIKTRADRYPALEAAIRERHPYELPEIIAVPLVTGLAPYIEWVANATEAPSVIQPSVIQASTSVI